MTSTSRLRPVDGDAGAGDAERAQRFDIWSGRRRLVAVAVAVVVIAGALVWVVEFSSVFGVRNVDVRGEQVVTAAQVRAAAHISDGTPLARLNTSAVAARVEQLAGVADARVSTSFPSTVTITVIERQPIGYVQVGAHYQLVDRSGLTYRTVAVRPSVPRFVLPTGNDARSTGSAVATVAAALPSTIRAQVTSIQALDPSSISLALHSGVLVQWGGATRNADKAQILTALLRSHPNQVDVTDPDRPFTR